MVTPWLTGAGAVGHMQIRWTVEAHVAAQEREVAMVCWNRNGLLKNKQRFIQSYELINRLTGEPIPRGTRFMINRLTGEPFLPARTANQYLARY
jgi:hypothetical protein